MKNNENTLFKVMEEYAITQDSDLITEDVYNQYVKYIQHISLSKGLLNMRSIDEKVSIVNDSMWKRIGGFDKNKSSMGTFLGVIIESAFLMQMRKDKSGKEKINNGLKFEDVMIDNGSYENIVTREVYEGKDDESFNDIIYTDAMNQALNNYVKTKCTRCNKNLKNILIMNLEGYTQAEISSKYKLTQSYVSRIIKDFYEYLRANKKRYFGMED